MGGEPLLSGAPPPQSPAQSWLRHVSSLGLLFFLCKIGVMIEPASSSCKDEKRQYSRVLWLAYRRPCHREDM